MKRLVGIEAGRGEAIRKVSLLETPDVETSLDSSEGVRRELKRLTTELEHRLPEHTYEAVVCRAQGRGSDEDRCSLLAGVLSERERSEAAGLAGAVA